MLVRERPPLGITYEIETPSGRFYRWAPDDSRPENIPSAGRRTSTMPGGFAEADVTLPRRPGRDYADLERLSTLRHRDAGGGIVGEYRLERAPRVSGDRIAISPSAVGWQAHLDDNKGASGVLIDRDLSRFTGPSTARIASLAASGFIVESGGTSPDASGDPQLLLALTRVVNGAAATGHRVEAWYDAGDGNEIASVYYEFETHDKGAGGANTLAGNWIKRIGSSSDDVAITGTSTDLAATSGSGTFTPTDPARYFRASLYLNQASVTNDGDWRFMLRHLAMLGPHGLTTYGSGDDLGLLASDMTGYVIGQWAPLLNFTTGQNGTIQPSAFVIPQAAYHERGAVSQMVRDFSRYELLDWAVEENRTFYLNPRGARGRAWRAYVGPAQLEETGPQVDRLWESIIVSYRDTDGTTRTVGPPGSGADTESTDLRDDDPENPANKLGLTRRDLLQMGTGTAASATAVGRRFLEQTKLLDSSGRARLVGYVESDRGVVHPYSHVRAGDTIEFTDAADTSPRRIVRAEHDDDARAVAVDLDSPPDALQAILERLNVVLISLGL